MSRSLQSVAVAGALIAGLLCTGLATTDSSHAAEPAPQVIGGTPARQVPGFLGSLQGDHNGDRDWHYCGTVLIGQRWALTNAHCVTVPPEGEQKPQPRPGPFHVRFGSLDRRSGGEVAEVATVITHPGWRYGPKDRAGRVDDLALLRLRAPVHAAPALIAPTQGARSIRFVGWGVLHPGDTTAPRHAYQVDGVQAADSSACASAGIGRDEVCLRYPRGTGGGSGDSGGPALQSIAGRWALATGGASRGPESDPTVGVYVSYWAHVRWLIEAMTGQHVRAATPTPLRTIADG